MEAFSTATATATVAPTMGLLPKENIYSFAQFVVFHCNLLYNISISILHNYGQNVRDTSHRIHIQLHERGDLPIKTLVNNAQKLFGMSLGDYLKEIGLLG